MAVTNVLKTVFSGSLGTSEIWQTSFWQQATTLPSVDDSTAAALAATAGVEGFMNALRDLINPDAKITAIDQYAYAALPGGATSHGHATVNLTGDGTNSSPYQVCAVMTLRTATPGRSGRGRMYLPATGKEVGNGGLFNPDLTAMVNATAAMFTDLSGPDLVPVVVSLTDGITRPITSVDADAVPDTQRRRLNKLLSPRVSHAV